MIRMPRQAAGAAVLLAARLPAGTSCQTPAVWLLRGELLAEIDCDLALRPSRPR
jgi:hypothetical protein